MITAALSAKGRPPVILQLQPSLFNQYQRHYFLSGDRQFRLTVDSELRFGPPDTLAGQLGRSPFPLIVLELKFPPQHAAQAHYITNHWPFRLARCSKYVLGIASLYS